MKAASLRIGAVLLPLLLLIVPVHRLHADELINKAPLFCAPETTFHFDQDGDIARLADYVTEELFGLTEEIGGSLDRYDDKPASLVLLLGLRAAFPCDPDDHSK